MFSVFFYPFTTRHPALKQLCEDLSRRSGKRKRGGERAPREGWWERGCGLGEARGVDAEGLTEVGEGLVMGVAGFLFEGSVGQGEVFTSG